MTHRENAMAILHYEDYSALPIVHFGFWKETLAKWADEGHLSREEAENWGDGNQWDREISKKLGFDFNWGGGFGGNLRLHPVFEEKILKEYPDGKMEVLNHEGVVVLEKKNTPSIPSEIDHLLKDRTSWEEHFRHRYQFSEDRYIDKKVRTSDNQLLPFNKGGKEYLQTIDQEEFPRSISCGSMIGQIRNVLGIEGLSYLYIDDEDLYTEIIDTVGQLSIDVLTAILDTGAKFDYGHFWEDICYKNGPLVTPGIFEEKCGPWYKKITDLLLKHGIDIVSLDSDGKIDALLPIWLKNGVNTMFPIEVGTWRASIEPWREAYGRELRGVGGMDKLVFSRDRAAVDGEIERLKPLVDLGGYIPCPDHRIAPDAQWENVCYYCDKMREAFHR